ncbi:GGDEF domain-containing protein [Rhabdochromatium marinum]|nr:GGDEF domain-containing protein [Rhabdochromatium marinum]
MRDANLAESPTLTLVGAKTARRVSPSASLDVVEYLQAVNESIELEQVVRTAMHYLDVLVAPRSWEYHFQPAEDDAPACHLSAGHVESHCLEYTLGLADQAMGHLTLTRDWHFTAPEQKSIDSLLGLTAPALRNALRFRELSLQIETDPMTGLGNRRALQRQGERWLADAVRQGRALSMMALDLDYFKPINDQFGHPQGDRLLCAVARVLQALVRPSDVCVRMGGDEFVVLLPGTDLTSAMDCAERVRSTVGQIRLPALDAADVRVSASVGLAMHHAGMTIDQLYDQADNALYAAKRAGRDRVLAGGPSSLSKCERSGRRFSMPQASLTPATAM